MIDLALLNDLDFARAAKIYEATINEHRPGVNGEIAAVKSLLKFCDDVSGSRSKKEPIKPV